jgi:hypothetical protein
LAAVALWCNLQYHREYVTETTIGSAVVKSVKDEWLEGKGENATVKIVIRDAELDNGLLPFGTEQLACNLTHCKEELDIHVKDQTYTILSPFMGRGDKKREMISYITRKGKAMSTFSCIEKEDQKEWKEWRGNGFGVNSEKRTQPTRTHYNWWDLDFDRKDFLHSFVMHCKCHLLNPFYIAFPNKELQKEGGDKAGIEAMIDYMNKHDIPLSSIPEWTRKFLEGEKDVLLGYWLAVKASNRQGEHDELFGYEELSGDDFLFDGNDSFDLLAVDHECGVEASTKPCTSVNPLQDASPSINLSQERGKKRTQDPVATEGQLVPQRLKHYCMPKEVVDLSLLLHGLTSNSAMRHITFNRMHLLPGIQDGHPLGCLISIGSQLKNGLNTWYSVVESTDPNALPPLNAPYKVNVYPPCIANGSTLHESSGNMEGTLFRKKEDSINAHTGISFCMCQHPRGELIGH